jgi:hypothetical protein
MNTDEDRAERCKAAVQRIHVANWDFAAVAEYIGRDATVVRRWFGGEYVHAPTYDTVRLLETVAWDIERLRAFEYRYLQTDTAIGRILPIPWQGTCLTSRETTDLLGTTLTDTRWRSVQRGHDYRIIMLTVQQGPRSWMFGDDTVAVMYTPCDHGGPIYTRALWHFAMRFERMP